jgi:hypothetical protein
MDNFEQKVAKSRHQKYHCSVCDYTTCKKSDFTKHEMTRKHQKNTHFEHFEQKKSQKSPKHICVHCGKEYKSRTGLWYHENKCSNSPEVLDDNKVISDIPKNELVKMMGDALEQIKKQSQQIDELIPKVGNNNNNTQFNLNIFLNEECKDAVDWSDFLKSIEIELCDLEVLKDSNITTSISNVICNKINELGVYNRPIHCYDKKRKKLCIKNKNDWEKDDTKVDKLIEIGDKELQHKYISSIVKWEEEHPNWMSNEKEVEEYMELQSKIYGDIDDKKNKILLVKELNIPK